MTVRPSSSISPMSIWYACSMSMNFRWAGREPHPGAAGGLDEGSERSSLITAAEIAASAYHYVALGHVHIFNDVSQAATRAAYCGTPAPLYSNDQAGSAAWVSFVPGQAPDLEQIVIKG